MGRQLAIFILRWPLNSFGLWIAARILSGNGIQYDESQTFFIFFFAGLILSLVNAILKPIITILSLPAILLTLGLFTLIINGLTVYIAASLVPGISINFWPAVLAGIIVSLINYVLTNLLDMKDYKK